MLLVIQHFYDLYGSRALSIVEKDIEILLFDL
jgi:hypothetical protein